MATFGERFKQLRNEKNLTQEQLANKFFLNKSSISRYERDRQIPEIDLLQKFADFFNVPLDYLLGRTNERNVYNNSTISNIKNTLGKKIKELREEENLTQEEFGKLLGIVKPAVSLYENGKSTPDDELKKKIAEYFNVSLDYLMGVSDIKNPYDKNIKINSIDKEELTAADELSEEIRNLSPESQEEIKKLIELYKIKDMQERNTEFSDELTKQD